MCEVTHNCDEHWRYKDKGFISQMTGGLPIAKITTIQATSIQNLQGIKGSINKVQTVS